MKNDEMIIRRLDAIIVRQNAMLDMMSSFINAYSKVNELPTEKVKEEVDYIDAT